MYSWPAFIQWRSRTQASRKSHKHRSSSITVDYV